MVTNFHIHLRMMHVLCHQSITVINRNQITGSSCIAYKDNSTTFCRICRNILITGTKINSLMELIIKISETEVACHNCSRTRICKSADHI